METQRIFFSHSEYYIVIVFGHALNSIPTVQGKKKRKKEKVYLDSIELSQKIRLNSLYSTNSENFEVPVLEFCSSVFTFKLTNQNMVLVLHCVNYFNALQFEFHYTAQLFVFLRLKAMITSNSFLNVKSSYSSEDWVLHFSSNPSSLKILPMCCPFSKRFISFTYQQFFLQKWIFYLFCLPPEMAHKFGMKTSFESEKYCFKSLHVKTTRSQNPQLLFNHCVIL